MTCSELLVGRVRPRRGINTSCLRLQNSNYTILENIQSGIGEWNSVLGSNMSNNLIVGYTTNDESRGVRRQALSVRRHSRRRGARPTRRSAASRSRRTTSCATTPSRHRTTSRSSASTTRSRSARSLEKYQLGERVLPGTQSVYVYNSLADFYTDANDFLANPNRTTSPVTLRRFQVRYINIPGSGQAASAARRLVPRRLRAGRVARRSEPDASRPACASTSPYFGEHRAIDNPNADALTFRDEIGNAGQYNTGKLPERRAALVAARRLQLGRARAIRRRRSAAAPASSPASRPMSGFRTRSATRAADRARSTSTTRRSGRSIPIPKTTSRRRHRRRRRPASTLEVTDDELQVPADLAHQHRRRPQAAVGPDRHRRIIYNRDVNGIYYINANLPAAAGGLHRRRQSAAMGRHVLQRADARPVREPHQQRAPATRSTAAFVMKNQDIGRSWNVVRQPDEDADQRA